MPARPWPLDVTPVLIAPVRPVGGFSALEIVRSRPCGVHPKWTATGSRGVGVPERVGERLLHDPVDGELLRGAERQRLAVDLLR